MSGDYYSSSRHHHDRHHRDNRRSRDYYDRRRSRERDSRDSNRDHYKQHRVPGHVSEPDRRLEDVDGAISRGQRETLSRGRDYSSPYKTSTLPEYRPPVTVSQPYLTKFNANYTKTWRRAFYNASFLAVLPGVVGFALLIAAIIVPEWTIDTVTSGDGLRVNTRGLFQVCAFTRIESNPATSSDGCETLEQFAESGSDIDDLEQATRGLLIIAAILTFIAMIVTFFFGLSRWERDKGALWSGAALAFAGACAVAGMGCYSGFLAQRIGEASASRWSFPGTSFFLGWCGTGFVLVAAITAFSSHCSKQKKFT